MSSPTFLKELSIVCARSARKVVEWFIGRPNDGTTDQENPDTIRFSLTWRMIRLLLLCWVLPVMVFIIIGGVMLRQSLIEQSVESLSLSVQGATQLSTLRMENSIAASRDASYIGTIKEAWASYQSDGDPVKLYQTSRTFLEQQYQTNERFYSTILLFTDFVDNPIYIINGSAGGTDRVRQDAADIFAQAQSISETLDTGIAFFAVGERVFMMRNLVDSRYETYAILMMELNTELIFGEFSQIADTEAAVVIVGDVSISILEEADDAQNADAAVQTEVLHIDEDGTEGVFVTFEDGTLYTAVRVQGSGYNFSYYALTDPIILKSQWRMVVNLLLIIFVLMLPLAAMVFRFFMLHVSRPINAIIQSTNEIRNEKYGVQLSESVLRSQEIGALGDNFNQMSQTLAQQFEHIYKEEIALRDARIMALQSQINPHFLNNTLEIINWEARMQGNIKVCNMLESLSTMLNAAMDRRSRHTVSLAEELMYVDAYLYIINERLGKRLVFEKDIPEEFLDVRVPRLVLQPLLENAVKHGITPLQKGKIALRAVQEGDWLILSVENDGGISSIDKARIEAILYGEEGAEQLNGGSLGLRNVHQRLRILYGEESGLLVDITKKELTVFRLKVKLC